MKKICIILLIVGVFISCNSVPENSAENQDVSQLQGKWLLSAVEGTPFTQTQGQKEAFIEFDTAAMQVSGNSSVNQFGGPFTVSAPGSITFSPMRSTLMASLNMETESLLYKAFPRVSAYSIKGDVLSLLDAAGTVLIEYTKTAS
ncbi:MAG: META domain-containing protein [Treponema sp.]|jgi:heat shock protein HslJ|nr:META domain-containing protein [Treponema sp.]